MRNQQLCKDCHNKQYKQRKQQQRKRHKDAETDENTVKRQRTRKEWELCSTRTQQSRLNEVEQFCQQIEVPTYSLLNIISIPSSHVIHLSTAMRLKMRSVSSLKKCMPSEHLIRDLKLSMVDQYGTRTSHFSFIDASNKPQAHTAYIENVLTYVRVITKNSSWISIGMDKGGDVTKLGITYINRNNTAEFTPLLMTKLSDDYYDMNLLRQQIPLFFFTIE